MPKTKRPRRVIEPDHHSVETFKVPRTRIPEPIMQGMKGWQTRDGWTVIRIHYSADEDRDKAWVKQFSQGYRGGTKGRDWQRELEIDFGTYSGDPVYPDFSSESIREVRYNPGLPLLRGWDFGYRNPAVMFAQLWPDDTLVHLGELFPTLDKNSMPGIKTPDLARLVIQETERLFPGSQDDELTAGIQDYCDPAGNQTKETSDFSSIEHLQTFGINPDFAAVGRKNRIEYLRNYIEAKHEDGSPKFLIHPRCVLTIKAIDGAYHYPEEKKGGVDRDMPDTSKTEQAKPYVHLMDAFEYVAALELAVDEVDYRRRQQAKPEDDDGAIAGDSWARWVSRMDHDGDQGEHSLADPDIHLDELLGIETDEEALLLY